jgi:hypothetical protein
MRKFPKLSLSLFIAVLCSLVLCDLVGSNFAVESAHAQGAAQSKDYWVSYLPSKRQSAPIWLLMCTNVPNTIVKVIYTADSAQFQNEQFVIGPNNPKEYKIINQNGFLAKPTLPEQLQNRTVHVIASNPISLQGFTDDDNNVGLFLILPTSSLGQNYVIASYNDQPFIPGNCYSCFDSSSGGFVITAVEDNTDVTITAHSPTKGGHAAGETWTITMNRGDNYWVQGAAQDDGDDLSQSHVTSTKPVAVIAGCEIMRALDAMIIQGHFDYNDYIVEQMIPVETWGTDYVSAPFTNKRGTDLDKAGDLYRVFAWDPQTTITFNGLVQNPGTYWEFPLTTDPVHITSDKPIMVVQYDYYEDFHFAGEPRTSNTEMVLVPRHNWRRNATFKVPTGYAMTYFAVAAPKDSIDQIQVQIGTQAPHAIGTLPPGLKYTVDNYAVRVIQLDAPVQAIVTGNCDFAVYNYGTRDNDAIKVTYGYAAAAAASFGSLSTATPPIVRMDSTCTQFNLSLIDTTSDGRGIGEIDLLNDPNGLVFRGTPYVSSNVSLTIDPFSLGATTVTAHVTVINALQDAFAALYVTDRAGKDTVYTFTYSGVKVSASPGEQFMQEILYGTDSCANYLVTNNGKLPVTIKGVTLESTTNGQTPAFTLSTTPTLPTKLGPNQTFLIHACYTGTDTEVVHRDSIQIVTDCYTANLAEIKGSAAVPLIYSLDVDFGNVVINTTKCKTVQITNVSTTKDLVITKNVLFNSQVFTIDPNDLKRLPITLKPLQSTTINVCYTPSQAGYDTTIAQWGSDIPSPYTHDKRDISILIGRAVNAGVNWDLSLDSAATVCTQDTVLTLQLQNTGDADAQIDLVSIVGPDAAEFTIQKVGSQSTFGGFPLSAHSSMDVLTQFVANTASANPWRVRHASLLVASTVGTKHDTTYVALSANVSHPQISTSQTTINFNEVNPGTPQTATFTVTNTGTSPMTIQNFSLSDPTFTVVTGLTNGQILLPSAFTTVTVQALNATAGTYNGTLNIVTTGCGGNASLLLAASYISRSVQTVGANYDTTWTCESNQQTVQFCNTGSVPVLFKGALITASAFNGIPATHASMFVFGDQGTLGKLANDSTFFVPGKGYLVPPDSCLNLPIRFNPTAIGYANAVVTFSYDSLMDGNTQTQDRAITANAKILPVEITAVASNSLPYSQSLNQPVEIPITVKQDLTAGDIYGYEFDLLFNSDMFDTIMVKPGDMGYSLSSNSAIVRSGDTNYVRMTIRGSGQSKITDGERTLAKLELLPRLARQDSTTITPMNLTFFRKDGSSICYTPTTNDPALYIQPLLCGDPTIRSYLQTGSQGIVHLLGNAPNPFSGSTDISFIVNANKTPVTIEVYDLLGRKVASLLSNVVYDMGTYSLKFDASNFASGGYYCRILGGTGSAAWTESSRLSISK